MKKIKISFIGAGKTTTEYLRVIKKFKSCEVVGIVGKRIVNAKKLSKLFNISFYGKNIKKMLKQTHPNIVIICVPATEVLKICKIVFPFNCISFIEKPVGINFQEYKKILFFKEKYSHQSYIALNRRYYSSTKKILKEIKNDSSKRIVNVTDQQNLEKVRKLGYDKKSIKYWMFLNSIHLIDYLSIFCRGSISKVKIFKKKIGKCRYIDCRIEFSSGDIGIYQAYWNRPGFWSMSLSLDNHIWNASPLEKLSCKDSCGNIKNFRLSKFDSKYKPGFYLQIKDLINVYKAKKNSLVSINSVNQTMKLINDIYIKDEKI